MQANTLPQIIQGGMGVGVSSWQLAKHVSKRGQLGVVSGTAVAVTFARRLQEVATRLKFSNILKDFPFPKIAARILAKYAKDVDTEGIRYQGVSMPTITPSKELSELMVVATYAEIKLAKEGHDGIIGVNFLEKLQVATLPSLYGALLADVDYVIMGAGIPIRIPGLLTDLSQNKAVGMPVNVANSTTSEPTLAHFDPTEFASDEPLPSLRRPKFLAIVSSSTLASHLFRSSYGAPDGFIVEYPIAGGHNAPPRGKYPLNENGEPVYGVRDEVDLKAIQALGLPYWLAGGYGSNEGLITALELGAAGIQVGTAFALCEESGLEESLKHQLIDALKKGTLKVKTDPLASPTGFPFKVVDLENTIGDEPVGNARKRVCDLGYLREPYYKEDGQIGYRCPAEPVDAYVKKGGKVEDTVGRRCLCNGLVSAMGLAQVRKDQSKEVPLITAGDDLLNALQFLAPEKSLYTADDVLNSILGTI